MKEKVTMNKMGTQNVQKIMMSMGIPMILSMVLQACYNIVDSMFVARIPDTDTVIHRGEYAVNALTLAFPVQMLIVAFGIGTGIGVNALLSKSLGQKDEQKVAKTAGNGIFLGCLLYVLFFLFGLFGIKGYLHSQSTDVVILEMGEKYLNICTLLSFGILLFSIYEKLLQSTGKTVYSTIAQVSGAVANIILDPIMIFGYLGFPEMGVAGAAYATVIGQMISMIVAMLFHYTKNREVKSGWRYLKPEKTIIREIFSIGLPAIIMQALMSLMTYGVNIIFGAVSTSAVTAYGIFYKIQQFVFFAAFGLRDAITPIVSYNYGMGNTERVKKGIYYGLIDTSIIMIAGILILQLFASPLVHAFGLSDDTAKLCVVVIRIVSAGFLLAGGNIAIQGVFQGLGSGAGSLVISLLRLCIVVLPLAWWFSTMENALFLMWFAFPIAEGVAFIAAIGLLIRDNRKKLKTVID